MRLLSNIAGEKQLNANTLYILKNPSVLLRGFPVEYTMLWNDSP